MLHAENLVQHTHYGIVNFVMYSHISVLVEVVDLLSYVMVKELNMTGALTSRGRGCVCIAGWVQTGVSH